LTLLKLNDQAGLACYQVSIAQVSELSDEIKDLRRMLNLLFFAGEKFSLFGGA